MMFCFRYTQFSTLDDVSLSIYGMSGLYGAGEIGFELGGEVLTVTTSNV